MIKQNVLINHPDDVHVVQYASSVFLICGRHDMTDDCL